MKGRPRAPDASTPIDAERIISWVRDQAFDLFQTQRLLCAEAVVLTLNKGFHGGLTEEQAINMASPLCEGLGASGCLCGAISGALMACGLLLPKTSTRGRRKRARKIASRIHNLFKETYGSTCCRVLTRKVKGSKKAHMEHCATITAFAAENAARIIIEENPVLIERAACQGAVYRTRGKKSAPSSLLAKLSQVLSFRSP